MERKNPPIFPMFYFPVFPTHLHFQIIPPAWCGGEVE